MLEGYRYGNVLVKKHLFIKIKMSECFQKRNESEKVYASNEYLNKFLRYVKNET